VSISLLSVDLGIGLLAGFALGAIAVWLARFTHERRGRRAERLVEALGLPLLGRVPAEALDGPAGGEGNAAITPGQLEAVRSLTPNLNGLGGDQPPRTILITSGGPGEGKSATALSLAVTAALAGRRTLLVEGDLRRPSLARRLGIGEAPGLSQYLRGEAEPQEVLQIVSLASPNPGAVVGVDGDRELICIAGGGPAADSAELLGSERCRDFLAKVGSAYDSVLIDAGPLAAEADARALIPAVDAVLLCLQANRATRRAVEATRSLLAASGSARAGVVLTGTRDEGP
jgi:capsular exopolysaccharide synthesis family protein